MRKILVVEDELLLRESYEIILSSEPYEVRLAENGESALELCRSVKFDLVLLDLMMPRVNGVMFLERMREQQIALPKTIVMSNLSSGKELAQALRLGVHKSVIKADLSPRQLLSMIRYELETQ